MKKEWNISVGEMMKIEKVYMDMGKRNAIKDILDIIKKLEVKPKDNSITRFTPYIYSEAIQAQIQNLDKTEQKKK